jgi:hypothetical protein
MRRAFITLMVFTCADASGAKFFWWTVALICLWSIRKEK